MPDQPDRNNEVSRHTLVVQSLYCEVLKWMPNQGPSSALPFDYCFVLTGFPPGAPSGGRKIVYELTSRLANDGLNVAIAFMREAESYLYQEYRDRELLPATPESWSRWLLIRPMTSQIGSWLTVNLINRVLGVEFDFSKLDRVKFFFPLNAKNLRIETKRIVATYWMTAYFVRDFVRSHTCRSYYFIQNKEDDPSFSGRLSDYASRTYAFDLEKLVLNHRDLNRFKLDNSRLIRIGFDKSRFHLTVPIDRRTDHPVLVPLRKGKGWEYGLGALKIIHQKFPHLPLLAFGNIAPNLVPAFVRYHRTPSDNTLAALYNSSSVFVLPSVYEGSSATVLEAMAAGNAIVATDSGNDELVDGETAIITPVRDELALAQAVESLMRDDNLRVRMQKAASDFASVGHDYELMTRQFVDVTR